MKMNNKKPTIKKSKNNDKTLWIIIGITTVALGGVGYWYYRKRKKKQEAFPMGIEDTISSMGIVSPRSSGNSSSSSSSSTRPSRFRCSSSSYPLQYGTCHRDVKVLQSYLSKVYKADLGRSGRNKDGVDGMFGNKTNRAAKKHLQKTSFSKQDIEGMKTANKTIKR